MPGSIARRLIATLALAALAGCQAQTYTSRGSVNQEPMTVDQAMLQRQWEPVTAAYENGGVLSHSTGFGYSTSNVPPYAYSIADTGTFIVNVVTMPYTFYKQWGIVESGGVKLPPSYTAVPAQPPSTQPVE